MLNVECWLQRLQPLAFSLSTGLLTIHRSWMFSSGPHRSTTPTLQFRLINSRSLEYAIEAQSDAKGIRNGPGTAGGDVGRR